ncbi:MAG: DNA-directed RNA polymerase subunit alpha [Bacteroidota bacterium]
MQVRTSKTKVIKEIENSAKGIFTMTPLAPGYGITIGNSLRRILHSSIEGFAITHVRFDNEVQHEFDTIEGVVQEVSEIILNLKQVRFKQKGEYQGEKITIQIKGKDKFLAKDIEQFANSFEILNPDLVICELDPKKELNLDIVLKKSKGYLRAEDNKTKHNALGYIAMDAVFSPIKRVNPKVTTTLVGQRTDYERLTIEIETDGSINAEDALQQAAHNLTKHFSLLYDEKAITEEVEEEEVPANKEFLRMRQLLNTSIGSLDLGPRVYNTLLNKGYKNLADLASLNESKLVAQKGFGKKAIQDIKSVLASKGLTLGMDAEKYKVEPLIDD